MRNIILLACLLVAAVVAVPVPETPKNIELVQIPLRGNKELDILTFAEQDGQINERNKRTIGMLRELFPTLSQATANDEASLLNSLGAGQEQAIDLIRVVRELKNQEKAAAAAASGDQDTQESQNNEQSADAKSPLDELTLDSVENDEENRGKRFLSFGGGAAGGSGGSGNFLFDVIRQTADRFARAAGTVYRVVAGTESLDATLSSTSTSTKQNTLHDDDITSRTNNNGHFSLLVSGSSGTEQSDVKANSPDSDGSEHEVAKGDGYTEGIPGPVTRLFVLANRGLSNLIQDLILRIAQTSERVVNFKARLITSLI